MNARVSDTERYFSSLPGSVSDPTAQIVYRAFPWLIRPC